MIRIINLIVALLITGCSGGNFSGGSGQKAGSGTENARTVTSKQELDGSDTKPAANPENSDGMESCLPGGKRQNQCQKESDLFKTSNGGCMFIKSQVVFSCLASEASTVAEFTQDEANEYCENLTEGGFSDWFLPTRTELIPIASDLRAGVHLPFETFRSFWTSSFSEWQSAQSIYLDSSTLNSSSPTARHATFCARNVDRPKNPPRGACLNEDSGYQTEDGGCRHQKTGLVYSAWPETADGNEIKMTQSEAKTYCDNLAEGGKTDWRLPLVPELTSLTGSNGARSHLNVNTNSDTFTSTGKFWTATASYSAEWPFMYVEIGGNNAKGKNVSAFAAAKASVICVRN